MTQRPRTRPWFRALAGICVAALFMAVAVPHVHADFSQAHQTESCRACKLQDRVSATPPTVANSLIVAAPSTPAQVPAVHVPRTIRVTSYASPRAPPSLS